MSICRSNSLITIDFTWEVFFLQLIKLGGHLTFILIFTYNLFRGGEPIFGGIIDSIEHSTHTFKSC